MDIKEPQQPAQATTLQRLFEYAKYLEMTLSFMRRSHSDEARAARAYLVGQIEAIHEIVRWHDVG